MFDLDHTNDYLIAIQVLSQQLSVLHICVYIMSLYHIRCKASFYTKGNFAGFSMLNMNMQPMWTVDWHG